MCCVSVEYDKFRYFIKKSIGRQEWLGELGGGITYDGGQYAVKPSILSMSQVRGSLEALKVDISSCHYAFLPGGGR